MAALGIIDADAEVIESASPEIVEHQAAGIRRTTLLNLELNWRPEAQDAAVDSPTNCKVEPRLTFVEGLLVEYKGDDAPLERPREDRVLGIITPLMVRSHGDGLFFCPTSLSSPPSSIFHDSRC
jgi:hypothetical protein